MKAMNELTVKKNEQASQHTLMRKLNIKGILPAATVVASLYKIILEQVDNSLKGYER